MSDLNDGALGGSHPENNHPALLGSSIDAEFPQFENDEELHAALDLL